MQNAKCRMQNFGVGKADDIYCFAKRNTFPSALGPWPSALNKKEPFGSFLFYNTTYRCGAED